MNNTMTYFGSSWEIARFVDDIIRRLGYVLQSTTIIPQEKLGGYFVRIVTGTLWVDTVEEVAQTCFLERMDI